MKVQLKVISGSKSGQLITINLPQFLVGRAEDCHLKPRSELISRYHCAILSEDGYVAIRDLGSKNGVFHNGHRVSLEEELKNGDRLLIGPLEFEVVLSVPMKGELKPRIGSIQDVVTRVVEQNNQTNTAVSGNDSENNTKLEISPGGNVVVSEDAADHGNFAVFDEPTIIAPANAAKSPEREDIAETKKSPAPGSEKAPAEKSAILKPAAKAPGSSISAEKPKNTGDASDWLFDEGEGGEGATQPYHVDPEDDILSDIRDMKDVNKEEEEKKEAEKKPENAGAKKLPTGTTKTGAAPKNTSDAAANLLKNFFKGGR
ncbi:MAG: FHA domain-containing protein [Planctomycetia bacterium]|nr:FHA domain-containing protein [Planctomycetia bacterium]